MRIFSQLDIAPTAARVLGINFPQFDGQPIELIENWGCKDIIIIIVDSLGYDLYKWMEPSLKNIPLFASEGFLLRAHAVSNHTTPSIATILSGLLPENHRIFDKAGAKESSILSIPEVAQLAGLRAAVIMERNGAEVYEGLIEIIGSIPDDISPEDFDEEACRLTLKALKHSPRITVCYFIGIDKAVHKGAGLDEIKTAGLRIDRLVGKIFWEAGKRSLVVICGDHPVHAGRFKRSKEPYCVALILAKGKSLK